MKITVLLPAYNSEKYLAIAIKSILNQTFENFELLIVDDGSTDQTEKIIKTFIDKRIRYVKKNHEGLAATLNYGLKIARYDWIARMDADDICHPQRFDKQISILDRPENVISCSWSAYFNDRGIRFTIKTPTNDAELKKKLALHSYINHASVIYNRKFILSKGGYNTNINIYEDYELWLRIRNDIVIEVVPEYLFFVRITPQSLSRKDFAEKKGIILVAQNNYYPLNNIPNSFTKYEKIELEGWREFFYGDKSKARKRFLGLKLGIFKKPKIMIAILLTFFSKPIVNAFIGNAFRYRIVYYLKYFSLSSKKARELLQQYS
jgi:glycosyltransferase involved in cell wall biosynthesis